ncbi:MAG: hypothetical protein ABI837_04255 [Acidobacteriota bacterium]
MPPYVGGMSYEATRLNVSLTITSLLSIFLTMAHMAADIVLKFSPGGRVNLLLMAPMAVWLYATLVFGEKRWGYILILILSLAASGLPVIHTMGRSGLSGGAPSSGGFFFALTLYAVGVISIVSAVLSARGLWSLRRRQTAPSNAEDSQKAGK